jgi:hypothetical protein
MFVPNRVEDKSVLGKLRIKRNTGIRTNTPTKSFEYIFFEKNLWKKRYMASNPTGRKSRSNT